MIMMMQIHSSRYSNIYPNRDIRLGEEKRSIRLTIITIIIITITVSLRAYTMTKERVVKFTKKSVRLSLR